jgi:hypothetical protein
MRAASALVEQALEGDLPEAQTLKQAVDDLKAYCLEAASAFPDAGTPKNPQGMALERDAAGRRSARPAAQTRGQ